MGWSHCRSPLNDGMKSRKLASLRTVMSFNGPPDVSDWGTNSFLLSLVRNLLMGRGQDLKICVQNYSAVKEQVRAIELR